MIREVITYPNPLLRKKSEDVVQFDEELHTLLDDKINLGHVGSL